jgi:hypothetical protein
MAAAPLEALRSVPAPKSSGTHPGLTRRDINDAVGSGGISDPLLSDPQLATISAPLNTWLNPAELASQRSLTGLI